MDIHALRSHQLPDYLFPDGKRPVRKKKSKKKKSNSNKKSTKRPKPSESDGGGDKNNNAVPIENPIQEPLPKRGKTQHVANEVEEKTNSSTSSADCPTKSSQLPDAVSTVVIPAVH